MLYANTLCITLVIQKFTFLAHKNYIINRNV